ncbi:MAG: response regulator [Nitrospirae bacterium]|nr:response regulator [Nitrospirota bacterium]
MDEINLMKSSSQLSSREDENSFFKANVLIVEDEAIIAIELQKHLESMGYRVTSKAASGEDAVLMAREENPDLVLMDITLSGKISGIEAARQIRTSRNIPVIYLTAHSNEETLKQATQTEPYGYLIKPVGDKELHTAIEIALIKHRTEKQLRSAVSKAQEEEAKTKAIIAGIGDGIILQDTDYKIIYENQIQKDLSGSHLGDYCYKAYTGRNTICESCPVEMSFSDGQIHKGERSLATSKGTRHYELTSSPIRDTAGKIIAAVKVLRDITERKLIEEELLKHREKLTLLVEDRTSELTSAVDLLKNEIMERRKTEDALRESERRYRELFNYMSSGITVYESLENGDDFIIKDFNHAGEAIDKIRKQDIIGERLTKVFPGVKESGLFEVFKRVWRTGETEHHAIWYYDDKRISGWRDNHIYRLSTGELISVYNDITDQVISAERESALLRQLKTIFENFPVGIVYLDDKFRIISSNKFFDDFAGFREGELNGKICYEAVGEYADDPARKGTDKICSFCRKAECAGSKKPVTMERPIKDKFIRVTTIPELNEKGNIHRFMEIVEDITDRKRAEAEAVRASHLAALGELAAGVAHEINNPINGIINYTQILLNSGTEGNREHDIARRIIKEGDRIANIVRSLLSFARDNTGDRVPANIADIISETLGLIEIQLKKDGIRLVLDMPRTLPAVFVQPQQIEQVFLNIISNARYALNSKYDGTHDDKILGIFGQESKNGPRPCIQVVFHDRGPGIRPDILDKIMNPFFSTKPGGIGTGLGLSISHGIISDHGGRLLIDSVEGKFAKVTVELPVRH